MTSLSTENPQTVEASTVSPKVPFYLRIYRNVKKIPIFCVFDFKETAGRLDNLK